MTRMVFCRKYQKELEAMAFAPFPGEKGQDIYQHVSKQAWGDWLKHQTLLINENHLNVMDPQARGFLEEQRDKFLSNAEYERPKGWVPEKK